MDEVKMTPVLIDGREVKVQGRLCRVAHADADDYKFLKDPEAAIATGQTALAFVQTFVTHASQWVARLAECICRGENRIRGPALGRGTGYAGRRKGGRGAPTGGR